MKKPEIWAYLIHLGSNLWYDRDADYRELGANTPRYRDVLPCDEKTFDEMIEFLPTQGINTLVIDLGEGVRYDSHPELAIDGSWTKDKLRKKLERMRELGITPIPKMNFSTCHDAWLQQYERMVSTPIYRQVTADLLNEACELFDNPAYFHLGMDEENAALQDRYGYTVLRSEKVWWEDFHLFCDTVEKHGARPWIWSDYFWEHRESFIRNMPKEVILSNWYYRYFYPNADGSYSEPHILAYDELDALGYDQIPTCSTWMSRHNPPGTALYCKDHISDEHLLGYLTAPWHLTIPANRYTLMADAAALADGRQQAYGE